VNEVLSQMEKRRVDGKVDARGFVFGLLTASYALHCVYEKRVRGALRERERERERGEERRKEKGDKWESQRKKRDARREENIQMKRERESITRGEEEEERDIGVVSYGLPESACSSHPHTSPSQQYV
jgi:hypothetical protein